MHISNFPNLVAHMEAVSDLLGDSGAENRCPSFRYFRIAIYVITVFRVSEYSYAVSLVKGIVAQKG